MKRNNQNLSLTSTTTPTFDGFLVLMAAKLFERQSGGSVRPFRLERNFVSTLASELSPRRYSGLSLSQRSQ